MGLPVLALALVAGLLAYAGCGRTLPDDPMEDAGHRRDGGLDAGSQDGGARCPQGYTLCGSECVDLKLDRYHCGSCDFVCSAALCAFCEDGLCIGGSGVLVCDPAQGCTNTGNDPRHCGLSCSRVCSAGRVCDVDPDASYTGNCLPACLSGRTSCNGSCVDLQNDARNCGACGNACPACTVCSGGRCTAAAGVLRCVQRCDMLGLYPEMGYCSPCGTECSPGLACQRCRF